MPNPLIGKQRIAVGMANRKAVLDALIDYPGITNREIAGKLGLNPCVVGRHVLAIRQTWIGDLHG